MKRSHTMYVLNYQLLFSLMSSTIKSDTYSTHSPLITSLRKPKSPSGAVSSEFQLPSSSTSTTPSTPSSSKPEPTSTRPCSTSPWRRTKRVLPRPPERLRQSPSFPATSKSKLRRRRPPNRHPSSPRTTRRKSRTSSRSCAPSPSTRPRRLSASSSRRTTPATSTLSSWPESATSEYL